MNGRPRIVCRRPDGYWAQQRLAADRAASVHPASREAQEIVRTQPLRSVGKELVTASEGGQIGAKDTVHSENAKYPPNG